MNPFEAHDRNQAIYEQSLDKPIEGIATAGNKIFYGGKWYRGVTGPAQVKQVFDPRGGGFSPRMEMQVILRKLELGPNVFIRSGDQMTVIQLGGAQRACKVLDVVDDYLEWRVNVTDVNEGA